MTKPTGARRCCDKAYRGQEVLRQSLQGPCRRCCVACDKPYNGREVLRQSLQGPGGATTNPTGARERCRQSEPLESYKGQEVLRQNEPLKPCRGQKKMKTK